MEPVSVERFPKTYYKNRGEILGIVIMNSLTHKAILSLLLAVTWSASWSMEVQERLDNGIVVSADYRPGEDNKPTVLVLHGFTTTRNFSTVQSIMQEMSSNGHTVLAPTLSMNINDRRASVPCDAIHTSTLEDDVAEVDFWVNWLVAKGHKNITLIGHSMGSLQLVVYAASGPHENIKQVIATSLIHTHRYTDSETIKQETAVAKKALQQSPPGIQGYHFVFCKAYMAPPQVYLSYMHWDKEQVIEMLSKSKVPVSVIMGGKDRRFGEEWIISLKTTGHPITVIDGASHFFDDTHEFDLLDNISSIVE